MAKDTIVTIPTRIDKACARENTRFAVNGPQVRKAKSGATVATATDGHILAAVECEGEAPPEPAIIPASLLAKRKGGTRLTLNGRASNGQQESGYIDGNFPPAIDVVPGKWQPDALVLSLNRKLLNHLADAIGAGDKIVLVQDRKGSAIRVMGLADEGGPQTSGIGVIMPVNLDDKADYPAAWDAARERLLK